MGIFSPIAAGEIFIKDFYETPYANVCLSEIIHPNQVLTKEQKEKAQRFCQIFTPLKEKTYSPQEIEIFFYQAGFLPVTIKQKLTLRPILRKLSAEEKKSLGMDTRDEIAIPQNTMAFVKQNQLYVYGQNQEEIPIYKFSIKTENYVAAQTPIDYVWETENFTFRAKGKLNHRAKMGDKVSVNVLGKNYQGILINSETVKALP